MKYSMKKWLVAFLCAMTMCSLCLGVAGCSKPNENASNGTNEGDNKIITAVNNQNVKTYLGVQDKNDLEFANSVNLDDKYHLYYFKLGTIQNAPIYSSIKFQYLYDTSVTVKFNKLTESKMEESFSRASENIINRAVSGSHTNEVSAALEISREDSVKLSAEVEGLGVKVGGAYTTTHKLTESISATTSETVAWSVDWGSVTSESNGCVDSYLQSYSEGYEETVNFTESAGFKKGNYYKMTFCEQLISYGVLIYDVANDSYSISYQQMLSEDDPIRIWEESEDGTFEYSVANNLYFDVDKAIEFVKNNKVNEVNNELVVDLSTCYGYESADLSNFSHDYYDATTGVFTAYGAYEGKRIDTYIFRGAYGLADNKGRVIETKIDNFSIRIIAEHNINIVLENMNCEGAVGNASIYRDVEGSKNKQFNDKITSQGIKNIIIAKNSADNVDGQNCVNMDTLTIVGNAKLELYGGNGGNGSGGGANGRNGGSGIVCNNLTIAENTELFIYGGNGGNGAIGYNGNYGYDGAKGNGAQANGGGSADASNGNRGGDGGRGGNGGNGGCGSPAIRTNNIILNSGNVTLKSGNGGHGGDGGRGGNGGRGGDGGDDDVKGIFNTNKPGNGGDGGNGGSGGNGGNCGGVMPAINSLSESVNMPSISLATGVEFIIIANDSCGAFGKGGFGGFGGSGGAGGSAGKDGNNGGSGNSGSVGGVGQDGTHTQF